MTVTLFGYLILISKDFKILVFLLCLVLVSIEKIYRTLYTVFDYITKHLEVRKKLSAARASYFQLAYLLMFGNIVKTRCLIYFFNMKPPTSA